MLTEFGSRGRVGRRRDGGEKRVATGDGPRSRTRVLGEKGKKKEEKDTKFGERIVTSSALWDGSSTGSHRPESTPVARGGQVVVQVCRIPFHHLFFETRTRTTGCLDWMSRHAGGGVRRKGQREGHISQACDGHFFRAPLHNMHIMHKGVDESRFSLARRKASNPSASGLHAAVGTRVTEWPGGDV